jgi:glycosyltransferase involved in cell wall biosynthesis
MRVALVHDHLVQDGGAERVLQTLQEMWPEAPVYTLVYNHSIMGKFVNAGDVRTSFLSRIPGATRGYRWFLPLMPTATESYDLRGYDVVISSASAFAKGIITHPGTLHICYCHTPTRYLWSHTHEYAEDSVPRVVRPFMPPIMNTLRTWDRAAAGRVDAFIANSQVVADRIQKYYQSNSTVIHPPVDVDAMRILSTAKTDSDEGLYFVAGGRLVAYKRFDLLIETFNTLGIPLVIFGDGPEMSRLQNIAWENVRFVGRVDENEKARLYAGALAYLHPQEEDFGITAVEAMACGTPVIAYRAGGALETVREGVSGVFFDEQTPQALRAVVQRFSPRNFSRERIREHALQFSKSRFISEMRSFVEQHYAVCQSTKSQRTQSVSHSMLAHSS